MIRVVTVVSLLLASAFAAARPMIVHETQRIDPPPGLPLTFFAYSVAVDGDWALVTAGRQTPPYAYPADYYALLYRYGASGWAFDRVLVSHHAETSAEGSGLWVGMGGNRAAVAFSRTRIFERSGSTWNEIAHPFTAPHGDPAWSNGPLLWSGNSLLAGQALCDGGITEWGGWVATRTTTGWTTPQHLASGDTSCIEEPLYYSFSGNTALIATWPSDWEQNPGGVHVYKNVAGTWQAGPVLPGGTTGAAVTGTHILVSGVDSHGTQVRLNDGTYAVVDRMRTVSSYNRDTGYYAYLAPGNGFVLQSIYDQDRPASLQVFRQDAAGRYQHTAIVTLSASNGDGSFSGIPAIGGRRLLIPGSAQHSSSNPVLYAFELPTTFTPSPMTQFTFEDGSAGDWTPGPGTFVVATSGANRVYRQSSLTGDARAVLAGSDWMDQSVEADIRPTQFASGTDRWFGLAVRYVDPANYYYVTLRSTGFVQIKRMVNGVYTLLTQKALPIAAGRRYHVAFKAMGSSLRVYIDGRLFTYAEDGSLTHGRVALLGYRTAVDYDNVIVNQVGQSTIYDDLFSCRNPVGDWWTLTGSGAWTCPASGTLTQASTAGDARAVVGVPTGDQVVTARARATAFAAPQATGSQERWFGLATRYADAGNYYYLTVRNTNTVSLRKLVNGAVTVLGTAPLTVTPGTWYELRLDAVGNQLRAFVNGVQVLQVTDATHPGGQAGPITFKAAAEYANYLSWQP